jgi:serine phosphatase RsbU (regulator of sigma subunit)
MSGDETFFRFSDEERRVEEALQGEPGIPQDGWKILIADDEEEVHRVTRLVLGDFKFHGRPLVFLSAYSAEQARRLMAENPDVALILLDVVMEGESSGLELVRYIRNELKNRKVRIILRTGQPGQAPEEIIILEYDINDYKEKTELSARRLLTSVVSALRSYRDIMTISRLNEDLEEKVRRRTAQLQKANRKLRESLKKIEEDQEAGRRIQYRLLPPRITRFGDYEFSRYLLSSSNLSGDFLDYFEVDGEHLGFYIADVSGHGLPSAFVTVLLKRFIYQYLERYRLEGEPTILKPSELLEKLNRELIHEDLGKYLTIFYGVIERSANRLTYCNGGQFPFPILWDAAHTESLPARGIPVGLFKFSEFHGRQLALPSRFVLTLISDGILEVLPQQRIEDKYRFLESLVDGPEVSIPCILSRLGLDRLKAIPDDITFLMIKKK